MDAERKEEIERELREEAYREAREGNRRNICPACGRDSSNFITIVTGGEECTGWTIECKCGELIDED